jgi:hypothetical protein
MKGLFGLCCWFVSAVLFAIGLYVHVMTVMDIPAAAMTQRLELSGWEWGVGGLLFYFVSRRIINGLDSK